MILRRPEVSRRQDGFLVRSRLSMIRCPAPQGQSKTSHFCVAGVATRTARRLGMQAGTSSASDTVRSIRQRGPKQYPTSPTARRIHRGCASQPGNNVPERTVMFLRNPGLLQKRLGVSQAPLPPGGVTVVMQPGLPRRWWRSPDREFSTGLHLVVPDVRSPPGVPAARSPPRRRPWW